MSFSEENPRQQVAQGWGEADVDLTQRYALRPVQSETLSLYRRVRRAVGLKLRELGLRRAPPPEPWLPSLNYIEYSSGAQPLIIWALGIDRDTLRATCTDLKRKNREIPHLIPVLITDVADFAFFSRLGWLVEYVPTLLSPGGRYAERKRRYLAWRYRDAAAVSVSGGLSEEALDFALSEAARLRIP
jgi:hypothetical protein